MRERLALEPAAVRGFLVTVVAVAAFVTGKQLSVDWIDNATTVLVLGSSMITSLLIRPKVASMALLDKLGIELPGPGAPTSDLVSGTAHANIAGTEERDWVVEARNIPGYVLSRAAHQFVLDAQRIRHRKTETSRDPNQREGL